MKQGSYNPKRMRGRNGGRRPANPRNQSFDSNGPDVKVRGNAQQVVDKYLALARDASSSGDRIAAESYYQHAEHYYRILSSAAANAPAKGRNGRMPGQNEQPDMSAGGERRGPDGAPTPPPRDPAQELQPAVFVVDGSAPASGQEEDESAATA